MARERAVPEPEQAPQQPETARDATAPGQDFRPAAPFGAATALQLQRTAGNAAVARLVAEQRGAAPPRQPSAPATASDTRPQPEPSAAAVARAPAVPEAAPAPATAGKRLQRQPYPVVPAMEAEDKARQWFDPAEKARRPVWTPEAGYAKNPSAKLLKDTVGKNGRIGGGFENGTFTYVVDKNGDVVVAKRLGEPGGAAGRATGMPHPTLIGGKNPTVLAAGEVEIRGGKIYRIDNQSGHFQPPRKAMSVTMKSFLRLPTSAFHPQFKAESVHYDKAGVRSTKPFRSLRTLKLKMRDFKQAMRGLKPRAIAGKLKGWKGRFGPGAKSAGKSIAGLLVVLALNYFLGKWMEEMVNDFIQKQIEALAPEVEKQLLAKEDELDALLEEDSEADVYINVRFAIATITTMAGPDGDEIPSMPIVELHSVGFSRQPWDPKPIYQFDHNCGSRTETTILTASQAINPAELFDPDAQPAGTAGAK